MTPAKLAVQVAHASVGAFRESGKYDSYHWVSQGMKKVVLEAEDDKDLLDLYYEAKATGYATFLVVDAGYTEFDGPTMTCLAIGPKGDSDINKLTGNRKLYKGVQTKEETEV